MIPDPLHCLIVARYNIFVFVFRFQFYVERGTPQKCVTLHCLGLFKVIITYVCCSVVRANAKVIVILKMFLR
jgi:hypothetical protein